MDIKVNDKIIQVELNYDPTYNFYTANAMIEGVLAGSATFNDENRKIWLYKISTLPNFQHQGVGTALIYIIEYFAYNRGIRVIEGKYYPTNDYAKPFYEKHGYQIYKDCYDWFVDKYLNFEKIKNNIEKIW